MRWTVHPVHARHAIAIVMMMKEARRIMRIEWRHDCGCQASPSAPPLGSRDSAPDVKAAEFAGGGKAGGLGIADVVLHGAVDRRDKAVELRRIAFRNAAHGAIGLVADPAADFELLRDAECGVTESHSLHPAGEDDFTSHVIRGGHNAPVSHGLRAHACSTRTDATSANPAARTSSSRSRHG